MLYSFLKSGKEIIPSYVKLARRSPTGRAAFFMAEVIQAMYVTSKNKLAFKPMATFEGAAAFVLDKFIEYVVANQYMNDTIRKRFNVCVLDVVPGQETVTKDKFELRHLPQELRYSRFGSY